MIAGGGGRREEGRAAFVAGLPRTANPWRGAYAQLWDIGWGEERQREVDLRAALDPGNRAPGRSAEVAA